MTNRVKLKSEKIRSFNQEFTVHFAVPYKGIVEYEVFNKHGGTVGSGFAYTKAEAMDEIKVQIDEFPEAFDE